MLKSQCVQILERENTHLICTPAIGSGPHLDPRSGLPPSDLSSPSGLGPLNPSDLGPHLDPNGLVPRDPSGLGPLGVGGLDPPGRPCPLLSNLPGVYNVMVRNVKLLEHISKC